MSNRLFNIGDYVIIKKFKTPGAGYLCNWNKLYRHDLECKDCDIFNQKPVKIVYDGYGGMYKLEGQGECVQMRNTLFSARDLVRYKREWKKL